MINPLRHVEVTHFTLHHPRVPPEQSGLLIAQVSDIHMGPWVKQHHIRQILAFVDDHDPDVLALTGDYVGYNKRDIDRCAEVLGESRSPAYAVMGNHDHWTSTERCLEAFARHDIPMLNNASLVLETPNHGAIDLVGVDDAVTKHADIPAAFEGVDGDRFCLALNHVPSIAPGCADAGAHLILSGHTHNFQFNIPRLTNRLARAAGTRFFAGAYRLGQAYLYINRGLGSASWPIRIRALPELTFVRLAHGERPMLELDRTQTMSVEHRP